MKLEGERKKDSISAKILYVLLISATAIISLAIAVLAIKLTVYFDVKINFAGESCIFRSENLALNLFLVFATFVIFYLIYKIADKKINTKVLLALMLIITSVLGFTWIYTIQFKPVADQMMVKESALDILDGKASEVLEPRRILK